MLPLDYSTQLHRTHTRISSSTRARRTRWAPASDLKKIGIQPVGKELYELANGELVEYEHGNAELRFMNVIVPARIIFGPDDSEPILGVVALESAGFMVDPSNRRLFKPRAFPLKRVA